MEASETGAADVVAAHGGWSRRSATRSCSSPSMRTVRLGSPRRCTVWAVWGYLLHLRIGLSTGRLVNLMGDYYGDTVNRASRPTVMAKPGTTLMDPATEEALTQPSTYVVRHLRPRSLRGLGMVRAACVLPREA